MSASFPVAASLTRSQRTEQALFRGAALTLANPAYRAVAHAFLDVLLETDTSPRDLTVAALQLPGRQAVAEIVAREEGIAAGLEEFAFLARGAHIEVSLVSDDGAQCRAGDVLARLEGDESYLLAVERVGLNLLQRMSGIATAADRLQQRVARRNPESRVVATRKTPWGLLDKRAAHLGGAGTHRLGLGDAILIKNNHLALFSSREEEAVLEVIARAWPMRSQSAFIEVEVRGAAAAVAAAAKFRGLREQTDRTYPCLLLLDNLAPQEIGRIIQELRAKNLHEDVLLEASGGIAEENIEDYAAQGVDAISVGALTHSCRALDISQRIRGELT